MSRGSLVERVLGVTDPTDTSLALQQAYMTLTGQNIDPSDPIFHGPPQATEEWFNSLPVDQQERALAISETAEILLERNTTIANTFVDWPVYQSMVDQYGTKSNGTATALMIGALSPLSARSFVCLAEDVYGAGTSIIVDPEGGPSRTRHGLYIIGSGLELPLEDASVDKIHTNQLLPMLEDLSFPDATKEEKVERLIGEIARVAAPGAEVYMKEAISGSDDLDVSLEADFVRAMQRVTRVCEFIGGLFGQYGMEVAADIPIIQPNLDYLFDPNRNFSSTGGLAPTRYTLFAKKPGELPIAL